MLLEQIKQYKPYSISPGYNAQHILYTKNSDAIIENTTYLPPYELYKATQGVTSIDIDDNILVLEYKDTLLFTYNHEHYIEYHPQQLRFLIASIDNYNEHLYTLLLAVCNYLYNEYHIDQFQSIYHNWRQLSMDQHIHHSFWDANEYQTVQNIAKELTHLLDDIIIQNNDFMYLHYDSVLELLEHLHITFLKVSLTNDFLFQQENNYTLKNIEKSQSIHLKQSAMTYDIPHIMPLYTSQQEKDLPLYLQQSLHDNMRIYEENKHFLDRNDIDLIHSFYRGKTWSCLYYGPSGTGKTTKILALAGALGLPAMKIVGSRSVDEATLFGKYVLRNGETVFEYGPLALMMKYGGMFIFDEINMVEGDVLSCLNDVLDGTRQKILDNGEIIHCHPHFRFAESMNIGYAGTNEMNISHKSRIQNKIKISKLSIDKMTQIIVKETEINEDIARHMASLLDAFHNIIINEGNITTQRIDLRTLINWAHKTVDLNGDVLRASLVTVIAEMAEEDEDILNLEDITQIMSTHGPASTMMNLIVDEFQQEK